MRSFLRGVFIAGCMIAAGAAVSNPAMATPVASLVTSVPSPQPLGTSVKLTASATDRDAGIISFRIEIGTAGSATLDMKRDFSVDPHFIYTPMTHDGNYQFQVTARNNKTGKTGTFTISPYTFTSLVVGARAAVTATANPLVALYSSPPCPGGAKEMRVSILSAGSTDQPSNTDWKPCMAGQNLNFVVAGMRPLTVYNLTKEISNGTTITSLATLQFTTGSISFSIPPVNATIPLTSQDSSKERYILMGYIKLTTQFPVAFDLNLNPVWFYRDPTGQAVLLTRPAPGGSVLMIANGPNSQGTAAGRTQQIFREVDLAGNILRETNATRVSEQIAAMSGINSNCTLGGLDCLSGAFHHEGRRLPNGHTLTLVDEEKIFTDGTQGSSPTNPVDIVGAIIVDLDTNFQVAWYWRAFDHMNANRASILGNTCIPPGAGGCPPIFLINSGVAQDWLHGNSVYYASTDGSLLFSMRHQDWVIKIDYGSGTGTGKILWTLGKDGDFAINSTDPYPWFSGQHDAKFVQNGTTTIALFDNNNTRVAPPPLGLGSGNSRGYVITLDEVNKVATPILLADLGNYWSALGSAQLLANGDYHFEGGFLHVAPKAFSEAIEVFPNNTQGFTVKTSADQTYRSFRMVDLYTPPDPQ
jgi:arylsulfate sulfotransferase